MDYSLDWNVKDSALARCHCWTLAQDHSLLQGHYVKAEPALQTPNLGYVKNRIFPCAVMCIKQIIKTPRLFNSTTNGVRSIPLPEGSIIADFRL